MGIKEHTSYLDEFNNLDVAGYAALHPALFAYVKSAMAQPGKQYLLIGDTDHENEQLKKFLGGAPLAALFRNAAVPHVAVETLREMIEQKYLDGFFYHYPQYLSGKFTQQQMEQGREWLYDRGDEKAVNMKKTLLGFMQAGLRMTPADSRQWNDNSSNNAERLFLGDREVADYIRRRARGEKTGIVYGSGHFYYTDTLGSRFGRGKCVHIDVFADRAAYERHNKPQQGKKFNPLHVDMMPDKVYILDERSLEDPDPAVYFSAPDRDGDRAQGWREEVNNMYGPNPPMLSGMLTAEYLRPMDGMDRQWLTYVPDARP